MISTDGSVLALVDKENNCDTRLERILILKKSLKKLKMILLKSVKKQINNKGFGLLQHKQNIIILEINQSHLVIKSKDDTITIRLLEGEFPEIDNLIPEYENTINIDKKSFLKCLNQMMIMQDEDYKAMSIKIENNKLQMVFTNPNIGEIKESINIEYDKELIEANFKPNLFIDFPNVMNSDIIQLQIKDGETPCTITGKQDKNF